MAKNVTMNKVGFLYAFVHFSVETACFYFLYTTYSSDTGNMWYMALLFDALAFLTQPFIGYLSDKYKNKNFGAIGAIMILYSLVLQWKWFAFISICIGNALIHINGANATLRNAGGKLTPSALFVGGGSFGVFLGTYLGKTDKPYFGIIAIFLMVVALMVMNILSRFLDREAGVGNFEVTCKTNTAYDTKKTVLLLMLVIACRSYVGYAVPMAWKQSVTQEFLLFAAMGIGKMLGGVLSDKFGAQKVGVLSLLLSVPFLVCGNKYEFVSLFGVLLFSMTMSVTLGMILSRMKETPGFAFGITTVALFIGIVPAFFIVPKGVVAQSVVVVLLTLAAVFALIFAIGEKKN